MKQNMSKAAILAAGFCCTARCSDNDNDLAIHISGAETAVKVNFYTKDEPYVQIFNVTTAPETHPQLTEYRLPNDAVVHLQADLDKVDEYNTKSETGYELPPEVAYDLTEEVSVKAGTPKFEDAAITVHAGGNIEAFKEYLLPVSITSVEETITDDCCQTIYFILRGSVDASNMELLNRTGQEALNVSSEEPKKGDWGHSGLKEACLDGDLNTFWGADWSNQYPQPPHWIVIDLKKTIHIQRFICQTREEGCGGPKEVTVEMSGDNVIWTVAAKFKNIPIQGESRPFLPDAVDGRCLKVTIAAVNDRPHVTVSELSLFW